MYCSFRLIVVDNSHLLNVLSGEYRDKDFLRYFLERIQSKAKMERHENTCVLNV